MQKNNLMKIKRIKNKDTFVSRTLILLELVLFRHLLPSRGPFGVLQLVTITDKG